MAGSNFYEHVFSHDDDEAHSFDGNLYVGSTGEIAVGSGEAFRMTLENPAAAGRRVVINRMVGTVTAGPTWFHLWENPTTGLPTTDGAVANTNREYPDDASVMLKADAGSTELGGGTDTGISFAVDGVTAKDEITFIIPPGGTMGLGSVATGSLSGGASGSMNIWFYEEPYP